MIPPNLYPAPGPGAQPVAPNYADTYPAMGLSGLAQGFTNGLTLGHEWGHQADQLAMQTKQMENEAGYRNALLESRAPLIQSEVDKNTAQVPAILAKTTQAATNETDKNTRAQAALTARAQAAATAATAKTTAAEAKGGTTLDMIGDLSTKWDGLGAGASVGGATVAGTELKAKSLFPSTNAGQYNAAAQALAGKIDHDLNGRVNDVTIKSIKDALPGFYDTPESKANKIAFVSKSYGAAMKNAPAAGAAGADPHAQAVAWARANPGDPRSAAIMKINGQ